MCATQMCVDMCDAMVNTPSGLQYLDDYYTCLINASVDANASGCHCTSG